MEAWLPPQVWKHVACTDDADGKKRLRLVCRAVCEGASAAVRRVGARADAVRQLPTGSPLFSSRLTCVESLSLWSSDDDEPAALQFVQAFEATARLLTPHQRPLLACLRELHLHHCRFDADSALHLATVLSASTGMTSLRVLDLCGNELTGKGVEHVCSAICSSSHLASSIEELDVSFNRAGRRGALAVAQLLSCSTLPARRLRLLDFAGNSSGSATLGNRCFRTIADGLLGATATGLEALSLADNCADDRGARVVARLLGRATQLTGLRSLDLSGNPMRDTCVRRGIAAMLRAPHFASLRHLTLCGNGIASSDLVALGRVLQEGTHLTNLQVLDIQGNDLTPAVGCAVAKALRHGNLVSLQGLYMDNHDLDGMRQRASGGVRGVEEIAEALLASSHLRCLRTLTLSAGPLSEASISALVKAWRLGDHLSSITWLALDGCGIDATWRALLRHVATNATVTM